MEDKLIGNKELKHSKDITFISIVIPLLVLLIIYVFLLLKSKESTLDFCGDFGKNSYYYVNINNEKYLFSYDKDLPINKIYYTYLNQNLVPVSKDNRFSVIFNDGDFEANLSKLRKTKALMVSNKLRGNTMEVNMLTEEGILFNTHMDLEEFNHYSINKEYTCELLYKLDGSLKSFVLYDDNYINLFNYYYDTTLEDVINQIKEDVTGKLIIKERIKTLEQYIKDNNISFN